MSVEFLISKQSAQSLFSAIGRNGDGGRLVCWPDGRNWCTRTETWSTLETARS